MGSRSGKRLTISLVGALIGTLLNNQGVTDVRHAGSAFSMTGARIAVK
jgi:hypothetical protein